MVSCIHCPKQSPDTSGYSVEPQWAQAPALFKPHDGLVNSVVNHFRESTALHYYGENLRGEHCTASPCWEPAGRALHCSRTDTYLSDLVYYHVIALGLILWPGLFLLL